LHISADILNMKH